MSYSCLRSGADEHYHRNCKHDCCGDTACERLTGRWRTQTHYPNGVKIPDYERYHPTYVTVTQHTPVPGKGMVRPWVALALVAALLVAVACARGPSGGEQPVSCRLLVYLVSNVCVEPAR